MRVVLKRNPNVQTEKKIKLRDNVIRMVATIIAVNM